MGLVLKSLEPRNVIDHTLRTGKKEHRTHLAGRLPIVRVFGYAHDFKCSRILDVQVAEMLSDGGIVLEKPFREGLVYHRHMLRGRGILLRDGAALDNLGADGVKITVADPQPRRVVLVAVRRRRSLTLDVDGFAPVISFHRAIEREAYLANTGNRRQLIVQLAVES